jgi:hypothetical protein
MVKSFSLAILIAVTLTAVVSGQHNHILIKDDAAGDELAESHYLLACVRGFMQGFERGLYNNNSIAIKSMCLADDSAKNAVAIYDDYMDGGSFSKMLLAAYDFQYSV